jgi:hypothetical protein
MYCARFEYAGGAWAADGEHLADSELIDAENAAWAVRPPAA